MVKKSNKPLIFRLGLGLLFVLILIIIAGFYFFNNVPEKKFIPNNNYSGNVIMPAINYTYRDISVMDAKKLIDKNSNNSNFLIIDVSLNYDEGHIVNAISYPIKDGSLDSALGMLSKTNIYLVYGRNEIDSLNAAKKLAGNGFENIYRIKGNYGAWVDVGFKIKNSY